MGTNLTLLGAGVSGPAVPFVWEKSLLLGGVDETIDLGANLDQDGTDAFTFSMWVKPSNLSFGAIIAKLNVALPTNGYRFLVNSAGKMDVTLTSDVGTGNLLRRKGNIVLAVGVWRHLIFTYDGSKNVTGMKWYFNNVQESGYSTTTDGLTGSISSPSNLFIGSSGGSTKWALGNFKEVAFWPEVISVGDRAEVAASEANLKTISNPPTHHWRCGDTAGDDATATTGKIQDSGSTGGITGIPINTEAGDIEIDAP